MAAEKWVSGGRGWDGKGPLVTGASGHWDQRLVLSSELSLCDLAS